jgi:hypothetical protein
LPWGRINDQGTTDGLGGAARKIPEGRMYE